MSTEKINAISIKNAVYDIEDKLAIHQPLTAPAEGQVLTYKNSNITWESTTPPKDPDRTYYTAFEVMPHDGIIPVGAYKVRCPFGGPDNVVELSNKQAIGSSDNPTRLTESFNLRTNSAKDVNKSDVVIEWGDGTFSAINKGEYESVKYEDNFEAVIRVSHTYDKALLTETLAGTDVHYKKFIIKVYGTDYFGINHAAATIRLHNLVSRVFEEDLPIAPHVTNLSSFCYASDHLLYVAADAYNKVQIATNLSQMFYASHNLQKVYGFKNLFTQYSISNIFKGCMDLEDTDFKFPLGVKSWSSAFSGCTSLKRDIKDFFDSAVSYSHVLTITDTFKNCEQLIGTVPADLLWNNKHIDFTGKPFTGCSDEILVQVPVSWGGTNASIDAQLAITDEMKVDYSAFEVMPNAEIITAGTLSDIVYEEEILAYLKEIPACTTHKMTLRSHQEPADCDVVIDWGDGTVEAIKDGKYVSHSIGKSYELSHDYSTVASKDENGQWKKFIVKIYGKNYYTFRHNSYTNNNLISRAFDVDLPVASHIGNFASMLYGAKRILSVKFPHSASPYSDVWNWSSCFNRCTNAQYIFGFEDVNLKATAILNAIFEGCNSLTDTDFKYPAGITEITTTFAQCYRLQKNLAEFFPKYGFTSAVISITAPFYSCNSATLEDVAGAVPVDEVLWNSETTKWIVVPWKTGSGNWLPFSSAFTNANGVNNAHIKSTIPVSWGGTLAD